MDENYSGDSDMIDLPMMAVVTCCFREGLVQEVYHDHLGNPTAGIGHLLTEQELNELRVGDKVTMKKVTEWFQEDMTKAYKAAKEQAAMLNIESSDFIAALTSVNFQLGQSWYLKFTKTWHFLMSGDYQSAAREVQDSRWYRQTPLRVKDFQEAILSL